MVYPYKETFKVTNAFGVKGSWSAGWHIGVDLVGQEDKTLVSIEDGIVEFVGTSDSYGNRVRIKQDDGTTALYAHLSKISVKKGDRVKSGDVIGVEGNTGNSTGSHLHLEIHKSPWRYPSKNSSPETATWILDPMAYMGLPGEKGTIIESPFSYDTRSDVSNVKMMICGEIKEVQSVNIDGYNYIKLRDIACDEIIVDYDASKNLPIVDVR